MPGLAGILLTGDGALCGDDLRAAARVRAGLARGGRGTGILRQARALLLGEIPAGPAAPGGAALGVVLAGRIDNARALRDELAGRGERPDETDQAGLLRLAYRRWGTEVAARLEGRFAFAIHDAADGTLLCGRDRFGVEPLHYAVLRDRVVFASDLAALLSWPGMRRVPDADVLAHYLAFGFCPVERSPLKGVLRLPPGHWLRAGPGAAPRCERYWSLPAPGPGRRPAAPGEAAVRLRARIADIAARAVADSPSVAVLATGDAASAALAGAVARAAGAAGRDGIAVLGLGPAPRGVPHWCEVAPTAAAAADALSTIPLGGELVADPDLLGLHALLAAARDRAGHGLVATGGPELFLDRPRYAAFEAAVKRRRDGRIQPAVRQGFHATMPFVRDLYGDIVGIASDAQRLALCGPALIGSLLFSPVDDLGTSLERADESSARDLAARLDLTHGAPRLLAGLEAARLRDGPALDAPFLGRDFAEWCLSVPAEQRTGSWTRPGLLQAAIPEVRAAAMPPAAGCLDHWLRTSLRELLEDTVASSAFRGRSLFRMSWVDRLVALHLDGKQAGGTLIWTLLCLETWFAGVIDAAPPLRVECGLDPAGDAHLAQGAAA